MREGCSLSGTARRNSEGWGRFFPPTNVFYITLPLERRTKETQSTLIDRVISGCPQQTTGAPTSSVRFITMLSAAATYDRYNREHPVIGSCS